MKNRKYMLASLAVFALIFSLFYMSRPQDGPDATAEKFTRDLFRVAPPSLDKEAIRSTYDKLSDKAKEQIKSLSDIAKFAGVQDLPDRGWRVVEVDRKDGEAVVRMIWDYSGGAIEKRFSLVYESGRWKIDGIRNSKN